ncbi:hypothetical protein HY419_00850, partial [candidate division WWE3 bacterium]|nr:hypothetical protein [candidate division WWE3 bacterium]
SLLGIITILLSTFLIFNFLGPQIFSTLGLLSLDRFKKKADEKIVSQTPAFGDIKKVTNQKTITIHGFSEPGSLIRLFLNGPEVSSTTSDSEGGFTFNDVNLLSGQNIIFAKAESRDKIESEKSETVYITYDNSKPEIKILSPKNDEEIQSVDTRVKVKGFVNEEATVTVNSHLSIVDSEGNFESLINVKDGENVIAVMAIDEAGNESSSSIKIKFDKR